MADACCQQLRQAIIRGEITAGDRLPPERQLAAQLGVNRVTIRTALATLTAQGLVQPRQGSGYTVRNFLAHGGPELLTALLQDSAQDRTLAIADLLRLRRHLAESILDLVAARATENSIDAVERAVAEFADAAEQSASVTELLIHDLAVLDALLQAAHSPALQLCINPVLQVLREIPELAPAMYADPASNVAGYAFLIHSLRNRTPQLGKVLRDVLEERDATTLDRIRSQHDETRSTT